MIYEAIEYETRRKTFSQKVARFFEITDYILLIPTTLLFLGGFLYSIGLMIYGVAWGYGLGLVTLVLYLH